MATITVALAALRDVARSSGLANLADEIHEDFLVHRRRQGAQRFKAVPRLGDRSEYESIIEGTPDLTTAAAGLFGCYSFFKREWKSVLGDGGEPTFRRWLVACSARLSLVTITVGGENPYEIFESLNSTGLPLEEADLIRNYLFMQVPLGEQEGFQARQWAPFENRFEAAGGYAKLSPAAFYRSYLMREGDYCRNKAAYVQFKKQNQARRLSPADQVVELQKFVRFELWLRRPMTCDVPALRTAFQQIEALDITTAQPLLLHLLDRHQSGLLDSEDLHGCLTDLTSFVLRRSVCGESTRGYGRLFPALIKRVGRNARTDLQRLLLEERWPDDAAFIPNLVVFPIYTRERSKCRMLLEALELQRGHKETLNLRTLTVEHVLPQNIEGDDGDQGSWRRILGQDWQAIHESWVHTLGNLTLTGYNPELGSRSFEHKRQEFVRSHVSLNEHFANLSRWTADDIKNRGQQLAEAITKVWPRPPGGPDYRALPERETEHEPGPDRPPRPPRTGQLRIRIHWASIGKAEPEEEICEDDASETVLRFVERLIRVLREGVTEQLTRHKVLRYPLAGNPDVAFLNPKTGRAYSHRLVAGTPGLYLCTISSTREKRDRLRTLMRKLQLPEGSVDIEVV